MGPLGPCKPQARPLSPVAASCAAMPGGINDMLEQQNNCVVRSRKKRKYDEIFKEFHKEYQEWRKGDGKNVDRDVIEAKKMETRRRIIARYEDWKEEHYLELHIFPE